ncbi:MAG: DNA replication terminus site-binding protein [Arsenophonus endosymbiont of Dermacentor nuttalli]
MTLNAYRKINYVDSPDSINFGWVNKNIVNKVKKAQILEQLQKNYQTEKERKSFLIIKQCQHILNNNGVI